MKYRMKQQKERRITSSECDWKICLQVKIVRMVLDAIMVVIGVLLGGKFGVYTIITVIISGPIIQLVNEKSK